MSPLFEGNPILIEGCINGTKPILHYCSDLATTENVIDAIINEKKKSTGSDIIILTCRTEEDSILSSMVNNGKYKNKVRFSTCRKFKGLEAYAVILVDVDYSTFADNSLLFYVGASRAKAELDIITNLNSSECKDLLENKFKENCIDIPLKDFADKIEAESKKERLQRG